VSRPDIAIVGGGLIGRCLAWHASRSGARVVLYDSADSQGMNSAAWAAAGMIAPATEAIDADEQISSMGTNSLKLWPQWLAELPIPVFYRDTGTLLVWHAEDTGEAARAQSMLASRQAQSWVQCLEGSQIADVEPELGTRFPRALYVTGEAQVDNRGFLKTVGLALEEAGVESHWETAINDGNLPEAGIIVDCRGVTPPLPGTPGPWRHVGFVRGSLPSPASSLFGPSDGGRGCRRR